MKGRGASIAALMAIALAGAAAGAEQAAPQLRLELDLADGSHIIGAPAMESVRLQTTYAMMDIPLAQIAALTMGEDHETASVGLRNGDKVKGVIDLKPIELETVFGKVAVASVHIRGIRVMPGGGVLPAGEGPLAFGGVNWQPWRTLFEVQGDKLVSLPKARPGFSYGHGGNGRGATLMTNIGSGDWKDYRVEFDYCMSGVDPGFNPHGLPLDYRGGSILFHVADAKESWNESGWSWYALGLLSDGGWSLDSTYNFYCPVPSGYRDPRTDGGRSLAQGKGLKLDPKNGNRFRIEVRGMRIQIWVDDAQIVDVRDEKMGEAIGGQTLDHGGVGIAWGFDSMGWIRSFSAQRL